MAGKTKKAATIELKLVRLQELQTKEDELDEAYKLLKVVWGYVPEVIGPLVKHWLNTDHPYWLKMLEKAENAEISHPAPGG